jgi:insulysin
LPARLSADGGRLELWSLPDTSFGVPRAYTSLQLYSAAPRADGLRSLVRAALYEQVLEDSLEEFKYPLQRAGLQFSVDADDEGLSLSVSGYADRQDALLRDLAERVRDLEVDPDRFAVVRDSLVRRWRNLPLERPITLAGMATSEVFDPYDYDAAEAADLADQVSVEEVQAFADALLDGATATMLVHGNLTDEDARAMGATVTEVLLATGEAAPRPPKAVRLLPDGAELTRALDLDHDDSALIVAYQGATPDPTSHAKWMLLGSLIQTSFFTELRTRQQLGYVVYAGYGRLDDLPALRMGIQSSAAGPDTLLERVDAFVADQQGVIGEMTPEEFGTVRAGLIAELTEAPTMLGRRHQELIQEFFMDATAFDWEARVVAALEALTVQEMAAFYEAELLSDASARLIVRQVGHAHEADAVAVDACADTACVVASLPGLKTRPN